MNNNRNNNRRRGRGNNRNQGGANSGNRIDSRARGNAPQLLDKYKKLAQDAQHNGDRVQAEYYLQFADHYFRVIADNKARQEEAKAKRQDDRGGNSSDDDDEDEDDAAAMSMSAMEAELRDGVLAKLDEIADDFAKYRKLQDKLVNRRLEGKDLTPKAQEEYDSLSNSIVENLKTIHINNARIEALVEQLYAINKKLMGMEGKLMRMGDAYGVPRKEFLENYFGRELEPDFPG